MDILESSILQEGETCWRVARAGQVAVLVDAAAYFAALRASLLKARRSVFIIGWDIDSRTRLVGPAGKAEDGFPEQLRPFLTALVTQRPSLRVHILLWDYSMIYALGRELLPSINLAWKTPSQISVCLDDVLPVGACHHAKVVVIDDAVAFCGGLDLTLRRWDVPEHKVDDAGRVDFANASYRPFHDLQIMVDGAVAAALGGLARSRWRDAACEAPIGLRPTGNPWPEVVEPDFIDVDVGIARTVPPCNGCMGVREVEALYKRAIARAERSIYIEAQYLTADTVAKSLARRLREKPQLEVIIVAPNVHYSWLEEHSMNAGRARFMRILEQTGVADRVRLLYPALPGDETGEGLMVHSKLMIVDDRFLRVGSANLNNRSMGMDTECDLALEVADARRQRISDIRNRLLAEHLGVGVDAVRAAVREARGSLIGGVERLAGGERTLRPIDLSNASQDELTRTVGQLADPESPIETPEFVGDLFGGTTENGVLARFAKLLAIAIAILGLAVLWRFTPLSELTNPMELVQWLVELGEGVGMPLLIPAVFIVGGLVAFPVTILIAVVGMMFSPPVAFVYNIVGSLSGAVVMFFIGRMVGRTPLRALLGARINRVSRSLARRGIVSVAALRMVPIAPYSFVNLIAGATHISTLDFLLGTVLGMAPGILAISLLGHQLVRALSEPTTADLLLLALGIAGWLALCFVLQYVVARLRSGHDD